MKELLHFYDIKADQAVAETTCAAEGLTPYVARLSPFSWILRDKGSLLARRRRGSSLLLLLLLLRLGALWLAAPHLAAACASARRGHNPRKQPVAALTARCCCCCCCFCCCCNWLESGLLPPEVPLQHVLCKSASQMMVYLAGRLGPAVSDWHWGKLRSRFIDHLFAREAPLLRHLLGVGPLMWGGNFGTLKAHHFEPHIIRPEEALSGRFQDGLDTTSLRVVRQVGCIDMNVRQVLLPCLRRILCAVSGLQQQQQQQQQQRLHQQQHERQQRQKGSGTSSSLCSTVAAAASTAAAAAAAATAAAAARAAAALAAGKLAASAARCAEPKKKASEGTHA
ncbi:hypothetical protein Emag_000231 [Eimeria magna]